MRLSAANAASAKVKFIENKQRLEKGNHEPNRLLAKNQSSVRRREVNA